MTQTLCYSLIGYLINENELDYWKNIDKNDDLIYAFDPSIMVYRKIYEGQENLKNRYELYAPRETYDYLAICDITNDLVFYQKQVGIFEKD